MAYGRGKPIDADIETINQGWARKYLGGAGLATKYLYDETNAGLDPLGKENPLIFMTGPLTGTVPYGGRHVVAGLSPLTGIYGEAHSGGHWDRITPRGTT